MGFKRSPSTRRNPWIPWHSNTEALNIQTNRERKRERNHGKGTDKWMDLWDGMGWDGMDRWGCMDGWIDRATGRQKAS